MDADQVRTQLDRILGSSEFSGADRSSRFLHFVVERALDGRATEIKESVIGVEVLGRSPSFDPKTDPIVRAEAARLRTRLKSYYHGEGNADRVRITLPKGGYTPEFSEQQPPVAGTRPRGAVWLLAGGALLGAAAALLIMLVIRMAPDSRDILRLSVLPPRGASIESSVISPDGRRIALIAVSEGRKKLWVRELDSLETRVLPGTDDASFPFWSPDSHSVGFFYRSELKVTQVSGGSAKTIASARIGLGGAWSSQGMVLFPPWPSGGLYQVPAGGGTPKPATALDPAHGESAHRFPAFLPDGRHFLFLAVSSRPGESSIRVGSLDSTSSKRLLNADGAAVYAPNSGGARRFLLYLYGGGIMAQPFDSRTLELSGMPVPVVSEIASSLGRGDFSVSTTGVLAYRSANPKDRQLAWVDREGRLLQTVGPRNSFYSWSLSPDEKRIAIQDGMLRGAIWTVDLDRRAPTLLASDARAGAFFPIWSPDGSEILFSKNDSTQAAGGEPAMVIERQALNARTGTTVLRGPGPKFPTDWSSDGRFVAYFTPWPDWNKLSTYIACLRGPGSEQAPRQFTPGPHSVGGACFSPERAGEPHWVAYTSDETGRDEVYVGNFPGGDRKWPVSSGSGWLPHWRHDGRELFYVTLDGTLMSVDVNPGVTFQASSPRALFRTAIRPPQGPLDPPPNAYAVSRDGRRFLIDQVMEDAGSAAITLVTPWIPGKP